MFSAGAYLHHYYHHGLEAEVLLLLPLLLSEHALCLCVHVYRMHGLPSRCRLLPVACGGTALQRPFAAFAALAYIRLRVRHLFAG